MNPSLRQNTQDVVRYSDCDRRALAALLQRFGMVIEEMAQGSAIRGSFWGDEEAGLVANRLVVRADTPLHSALHETCHYICMDESRRSGLDTDAGGGYDEENGVCYLQILLAEESPGFGSARMMQDMDTWGYTFRLGSARAWFEEDAGDALAWLRSHGIVDENGRPAFTVRT